MWAYDSVFLMISACASHALKVSLTVHLGTFLLVWSFASNPCIRGRNRPEGFPMQKLGPGSHLSDSQAFTDTPFTLLDKGQQSCNTGA